MNARNFERSGQKGAVIALVALMIPVLVAGLGLAIDAGAMYEQNRRMQIAADSAALAAAQEVRSLNTAHYEGAALYAARSNGFERFGDTGIEIRNPPTTGAFKGDSEYVEVVIAQPQPIFFMGLFKETGDTIRARAVAGTSPSDTCLLTLNKTSADTLKVSGNGTLRLTDCGVTVNSSHNRAASATGGAIAEATDFAVVGGTSGDNFNPEPYTGALALDDPMADFVMPPPGACTFAGTQVIMTSTTLHPGVYCGGLDLRSQAAVTFSPGTYFLAGGGLSANAGAQMLGDGVTFVNTSKPGYAYDRIWINGGAAIDLTAPTTGLWQGILFYQDPSIKTSKVNIFNGGADMKLSGIVYFPTSETKFSGNFGVDANKLLMIGDKFEFTGNSSFAALPKEFLPRTLLQARVVE